MTLFHAICVLHLLSLLGFGLTASRKYGNKGRTRRLVLVVVKVLIAGAFLAFVGYIWITAPRFGSQLECNATTVYVIFFVSINATNIVFRYTIIALMIRTVVVAVISLAMIATLAACCFGVRRKKQAVRFNDLATLKSVLMRVRFKGKKAKWVELQQAFGDLVLRTIVNVYGILMLELTVLQNDLSL